MKNGAVIITAPHACPVTVDPSCDALSGKAARDLSDNLGGALFVNSGTLRRDVDMNRPVARSTDWRKSVRGELEGLLDEGRKPILLDVHSYSTEDLSGSSREWDDFDIVFLVHPFNTSDPGNVSFLREVGRRSEGKSVKVGFFAGAQCCFGFDLRRGCTGVTPVSEGCNDIVSTADYLGADAFLIEFNQRSLRDPSFEKKLDGIFDRSLIGVRGERNPRVMEVEKNEFVD